MKKIELKENEIRAIHSFIEYFIENASVERIGIRGGKISKKELEELDNKLTPKEYGD